MEVVPAGVFRFVSCTGGDLHRVSTIDSTYYHGMAAFYIIYWQLNLGYYEK